jgi:hypothetical protein
MFVKRIDEIFRNMFRGMEAGELGGGEAENARLK